MIGTRLAHFEITAHLGTGGMGEVYQATDTKLGRSVAIKLLPEAFARDAERVARFEREARVLASLNHPHIAAIYGLEESGDRKLLVMELAEGETLADRIKRDTLPSPRWLMVSSSSGCARSTRCRPSPCRRLKTPLIPSGRPIAVTSGFSRRASSKKSPRAVVLHSRCATQPLRVADRGTART